MDAAVDDTSVAAERAPSPSLVPFFVIWTGQAFSLFGSSLVRFALVWYLTTSTGSAMVLAFASLVAMLPQVVLGPVAGALVDRWNRRTVLIVADSAIAVATAVLMVLFLFDLVQLWHIYVLNFARGLGDAFHRPAMQASTTLMVREKHLSRVQGLNQTRVGATGIFAPALAVLLLGLSSVEAVLAIDVGTALLAIVPLLFLRIPQPTPAAPDSAVKPSVLDDLQAGFRFLWGWPGLLGIIVISVISYTLMVPAYSLVPLLITERFAGGAAQLAWFQAASAAAILAGGLTLSLWGGFKRRVVTFLLSMALSGMGWVVIGVVPPNGLPVAIGAGFFRHHERYWRRLGVGHPTGSRATGAAGQSVCAGPGSSYGGGAGRARAGRAGRRCGGRPSLVPDRRTRHHRTGTSGFCQFSHNAG